MLLRTRTSALLATAALAALALPAAAVDEAAVAEPLAACAPVADATVVTLAKGFKGTVPTPVEPLLLGEEAAGAYVLDLSGQEAPLGSLTATLSWDTPGGLGDYDLLIDGTGTDEAGDSPETTVEEVGHCDLVRLSTTAFTGTPVDTLTLELALALPQE